MRGFQVIFILVAVAMVTVNYGHVPGIIAGLTLAALVDLS